MGNSSGRVVGKIVITIIILVISGFIWMLAQARFGSPWGGIVAGASLLIMVLVLLSGRSKRSTDSNESYVGIERPNDSDLELKDDSSYISRLVNDPISTLYEQNQYDSTPVRIAGTEYQQSKSEYYIEIHYDEDFHLMKIFDEIFFPFIVLIFVLAGMFLLDEYESILDTYVSDDYAILPRGIDITIPWYAYAGITLIFVVYTYARLLIWKGDTFKVIKTEHGTTVIYDRSLPWPFNVTPYSVPLAQMTTINIHYGFLDRIFGTCQLFADTPSGSNIQPDGGPKKKIDTSRGKGGDAIFHHVKWLKNPPALHRALGRPMPKRNKWLFWNN